MMRLWTSWGYDNSKVMLRNKRVATVAFLIGLSQLPVIWLFTQSSKLGGIQYATGNILGIAGAVFMWWQFLLGIRFISRFITRDYVAILKLHKFLGKYGVLLALIHPFWQVYNYSDWKLLLLPKLTTEFYSNVLFGQGAFVLLSLIWILSALFRSKIRFRPWLYIHYLVYPAMAMVFLHSRAIGTFLNTIPGMELYWNFLLLTFCVVVIYRIANLFNLGRAIYRLNRKETKSDGITIYTFMPVRGRIQPKIGQFAYIRPRFFAEAHPFTVMKYDRERGNLTFGIKAVGPFTNQLEKLTVGDKVYLDGPYGVFTTEGQSNAPKVVFAGGIGITPFVELIKRFGGKRTIMFYANKVLENAIFREEFKQELQTNYIDAISQEKVKDKLIIEGRITQEVIKKFVPQDYLDHANFFLCGPPPFMAAIQIALVSLGVSKEKIYSEEF